MYEGVGEEMIFKGTGYLAAMTAVALLLLSFYLLAFFLSKHRPAWLVLALVFFIIDTVALIVLFGVSFDAAIDIICHAIVIFELVSALRAEKKLRALPPGRDGAAPYSEEE